MVAPNRGFGIAGRAGAGSPFFGDRLLIADRGNNRLLVLDDTGKIIWTYPSRAKPRAARRLLLPRRRVLHPPRDARSSPTRRTTRRSSRSPTPRGGSSSSTATPASPGSRARLPRQPRRRLPAPKRRHHRRRLRQTAASSSSTPPQARRRIRSARPGRCVHDPPTELGSPNGDTPLADGNLLVSEINGSWIDEYTPDGRLVWTTKLAIGYPSDPQQLGPTATSSPTTRTPGAIVEFNRARARSSTATSPRRGRACSTTRRSSSCCPPGCSC